MKARPILMSAPMVRALLAGNKMQTRRAVKQPDDGVSTEMVDGWPKACDQLGIWFKRHDYGKPGDLLWVRESIALRDFEREGRTFKQPRYAADDARVTDGAHTASNHCFLPRLSIPSIHMPRWASRLTLEITNVRVQRLQDISEGDALAEGIIEDKNSGYKRFHVEGLSHSNKEFPELSRTNAREMYAALWDTINGSGEWLGNPWVWALTFRVHQQNINEFEQRAAA